METSAAQRRLLAAAVDAFAENGFGGTSTRDIADRAGRSPAALYIHYPSKEAVLYAVSLAGHHDALDCLTRASRASDDPPERLRRMIHDFSTWHMHNAKLGRVVQYELHALSADHRAQILTLRREFHHVMADVIHGGTRAEAFHVEDVDGTARALLSLCIDLARWYDPTPDRDHHTIAQLNADLALRMVGSVDAPADGRIR